MDSFTLREIGDEMVECARFGELEEMKEILDKYCIDVNHQDENGNTALHKSSANGNLEVIAELLRRNASISKQNSNGNSPLHWAVTNKKREVVRRLLSDSRDPEEGGADVLLKNFQNRSVLTEAFDANDEEILKLVLEHRSADRLEQEHSALAASGMEEAGMELGVSQQVVHPLSFVSKEEFPHPFPVLKCRELALAGIGEVFGDNPRNDTTGVHLWSSSIVASYWVTELARRENIFSGKRVLELGCGCGLMGLAAAFYSKLFHQSGPTRLFLTDVSSMSLQNAACNIELNSEILGNSEIQIQAGYLNWLDQKSWGKLEPEHPHFLNSFNIVLGSDLVYDSGMEIYLSQAVSALLAPQGIFFYVHRHDRLCANKLKQSLEGLGLVCQEISAPQQYTRNPLIGASQRTADTLFNELSSHSDFYLLTATKP